MEEEVGGGPGLTGKEEIWKGAAGGTYKIHQIID